MKTLLTNHVLFLLLWSSPVVSAQSVSTLLGARSAGLGYASSTLSDEWAALNNIAGLAQLEHPSAAIAFDAPASMPGATRIGAAFSTPISTGIASASVLRFGDELYSEMITASGFSHKLALTSIGIKVCLVQYRAAGSPSHRALSISLGGITRLTSQITIGAYITNINQPRLSKIDHERLPTHLVAGLCFKPDQKFLLAIEMEKDLDYQPQLRAGFEYIVNKKFAIRTGLNLNPKAIFFGVGYITSDLKIDYALQYNIQLGITQQIAVARRIEIKKPKHAR